MLSIKKVKLSELIDFNVRVKSCASRFKANKSLFLQMQFPNFFFAQVELLRIRFKNKSFYIKRQKKATLDMSLKKGQSSVGLS